MKKAYIILAHNKPEQLYRLIERLDDGFSSFHVHIDLNSSLSGFHRLSRFGNKVTLVDRQRSAWARIGIVKAVLIALKQIESSAEGIDRIILLSGQDYPIKTNRHINEFLEVSSCSIFLEHWEVPNHARWGNRGGLERFDKYFFGLGEPRIIAAKVANLSARYVSPMRRRIPCGLRPFGGWTWWVIDRHASRYVLNFVDSHPEYLAYHEHTFAPDEVFFHTIILNSQDERLIPSIRNDDMRFTLWKQGESHPTLLSEKHLPAMRESGDLYARKFDMSLDSDVLNRIDEELLQ